MGQNISNEVLLAWFTIQAKIQSDFGVYAQVELVKYLLPPLRSLIREE